MKKCDLPTLFSKQAVSPPYFAFDDVWQTKSGVLGTFRPEQPLEWEEGPIAAAEVGRHLAILGACAGAAISGEGTRHYLATKALLRRTDAWPGECDELEAISRVVTLDKRTLKTTAKLLAPDPIYTLDCTYQVLTKRLFERMFAGYQRSMSAGVSESPYRHNVELENIKVFTSKNSTRLSATCGALPPDGCAGHFADYPTWPVAVVCHSLIRLAGRTLHQRLGKGQRFSVLEADVTAEHLAKAEEQLQLSAEWVEAVGGDQVFHCRATVRGDGRPQPVGEMKLTLRPTAAPAKVKRSRVIPMGS